MTLWLLAALLGAADISPRDFGAVADGVTLDTVAIQAAIDRAAADGGGRVVLDRGRFLSGSLVLRSGVRLSILPEATLLGSRNLADYPARWLLSADDATGITLDGGGTIDGQGEAFWQKAQPYAGPEWKGTAQFEYKALARPSFLHFLRCSKLRVRDLRLNGAPSWALHLQRCQGVDVEQVTIRNALYGPNTDGIDINSCQDVRVDRCDIITGDDGIVLKSNEPGHDHPSRRISVTNCRIWSACNALKIGTETHDSFEDVTFADCQLYAAPGSRLLDRAISGLAIESVDGADLSRIEARRLTMDYVRTPIFVRLGHRGGSSARTQQVEPRVPGHIRDVVIEDIKATHATFTSSITGLVGHPVERVALRRLDLSYDGGGGPELVSDAVPDEAVRATYPESHIFGLLPAYALYCRHLDGLEISDLRAAATAPEARPMLVADDVSGLRAVRCTAVPGTTDVPTLWLIGARDTQLGPDIAPARVYAEAEPHGGVTLAGGQLDWGPPGSLVASRLPLVREQAPGRVELAASDLAATAPMTREQGWLAVPAGSLRDRGSAAARVEVSVAGEYEVWVRGYSAGGESDSYYLTIDRGPRYTSDWRPPAGSWAWDRLRDRRDGAVDMATAVSVKLDAGVHVLRLTNRESGMRVERIVLVKRDLRWQP